MLFWDKLIFHKDIIKSSDLYVNKTNKRRDCKRRSLDWTIMRNIFLGQVLIVCKLCQDPWWILNALHITARDQFIWLYIVRPIYCPKFITKGVIKRAQKTNCLLSDQNLLTYYLVLNVRRNFTMDKKDLWNQKRFGRGVVIFCW